MIHTVSLTWISLVTGGLVITTRMLLHKVQ